MAMTNSDKLHVESTPVGWTAYYDPEGLHGDGGSQHEAVVELLEQTDEAWRKALDERDEARNHRRVLFDTDLKARTLVEQEREIERLRLSLSEGVQKSGGHFERELNKDYRKTLDAIGALVGVKYGPESLIAAVRDRVDYAEELTKLATTFVDAFYREFHSPQSIADKWEGWENGLSNDPEDQACLALMKFLSTKGAALSKNTTTAGADSPYVQAPAKEDRIRPEPSASTPEQALSPSGGSVPRDPEPTHIAQSAPATIPPIGGITEFHSENLADYTVSVLGVFRPVPEGWKLVPMLPNEEMIAVARRPHALGTTNRGQIEGAYVAMVHAAPEPPAVPSQVNSDTARLDWLAQQQGNLFTPATSSSGLWAWFGNDARAFTALGLRALIDDAMRKDAVLVEGTDK